MEICSDRTLIIVIVHRIFSIGRWKNCTLFWSQIKNRTIRRWTFISIQFISGIKIDSLSKSKATLESRLLWGIHALGEG
jgi:hypothetical protein